MTETTTNSSVNDNVRVIGGVDLLPGRVVEEATMKKLVVDEEAAMKKPGEMDGGVATPVTASSLSSSPSSLSSCPPADDVVVELLLPPTSFSSTLICEETTAKAKAGGTAPAWTAPASRKSLRTHNPIRAIVDPIMSNSIKSGKERGDGKDQISLALGDPTAYGNIPPCPAIASAVAKAMTSTTLGGTAGYVNACGQPKARAAVARHHSSAGKGVQVDPKNVIIASGASGALELALTALLDEDSVLLVPRPGFPLYQVIAESHGATVAHYDLLPDRGWEVDLDQVEAIILRLEAEEEERGENERSHGKIGGRRRVVRGMVVNNPSNPTGAVYSTEHLSRVVEVATRHRVPIVADEIYGDMTFGGATFRPLAEVAAGMGRGVPVITASGLGKQYLVPGWRLGWIVFQDTHHGAIREVEEGARRLAQVVLGSSHLAQVAIPAALDPRDESDRESTARWKEDLHAAMERQAGLLCGLLDECHGLRVIFPEGAMYAMVRIEVEMFDADISDDVSFMRLLLEEENVVVLPGRAFGLLAEEDGYGSSSAQHVFRVVFCAPEDVLRSAAERISSFCIRHGI